MTGFEEFIQGVDRPVISEMEYLAQCCGTEERHVQSSARSQDIF